MNQFILITGMVLLIAILLVGFILFFSSPDSIKNGKDYILEYHRVAKTGITEVKPKIFFYFQIWPISGGKQVLPIMYASFRRFYFLIMATFWGELARAKTEKRWLAFLTLAWSSIFSTIFLMAGAILLLSGFYFGNNFYIFWSIITILGGFALMLLPSYTLLVCSVPIIKKMNISEHDKKQLVKLIKIYFVIALISAIYQIIRFIIQNMDRDNS